MKVNQVVSKFSIKFHTRHKGYEIMKDSITFSGKVSSRQPERDTDEMGEVRYFREDDKIKIEVMLHGKLYTQLADRIFRFSRNKISNNRLLIQEKWPLWFMRGGPELIDISIYDFDPKLSKKAVPITGKAQLEQDGSNLAIVLRHVLESNENKRKFSNLIKDLLPQVSNVRVQDFADRSLLFNIKEKYYPKRFLPAPLISDGTISIAALILGIFFDNHKTVVIEEPERNLHPHLISKIVSMMKDASENKQVLITTHNPEFVRNADLSALLLVSRDTEGFSTIVKPKDMSNLKAFLENDLTLAELYIQNLLTI
jgi:Predicted ATPase